MRSRGAVLVLLLAACTKFGEDPPPAAKAPLVCKAPPLRPGKARARPAFPGVTFTEPTRLVRSGERWYVAERRGVLRTFPDRGDVASSSVFVDLAGLGVVYLGNEYDGVQGFTLHPRFADNGEAFVAYTAPTTSPGAAFEYRVDRLKSRDGGLTVDPATRETVLAIPRDSSSHHGGPLVFGADGMLYVATGDGFYGDRDNHAQRMDSLRGKILRIDVDSARPYVVPADNPFVSDANARPEIWAVGFRNPFSMWLDRDKGDLWVGDVGQSRFEEIDIVTRGKNYGWKVREGGHCYGDGECASFGFEPPVYEYSHGEGFCVVAGFVYRGAAFPDLRESFIFGDYVTGRVSALRDGAARVILESGRLPAHFAESREGEILFLDYGTGTIQQIAAEDREAVIPPTLSATGCIDPKDGRVADTMIPYDVNMALWSDGAEKKRWMMIPDGDKRVTVDPGSGELSLPTGSLVFKTFVVDGRNVETRMLVNHAEGGWAGYTYAWNADGSDAVLLETGETRDLGGGRRWIYPSRSDCFACHNAASGRTLGLRTGQLERDGQLDALAARGVFAPGALDLLPYALSDGRDSDPIEHRARSYLDVNCANCHVSNGPAGGLGDLRAFRPLVDMGICNVPEQSGAPDAVRLRPGDPDGSAIVQRMRAHDGLRMPPLGTGVVDERGVAWVSEWIRSLPAEVCPVQRFPLNP